MNECWYALALALLSTDYYTPELAFDVLSMGVKSKNKITDNDTEDMIELQKTMTYTQIAEMYGMDRTTVWRRINKKPKKRVNERIVSTDVADMVRLKETMSYREIGEIYGISGQSVYNRIGRPIKL